MFSNLTGWHALIILAVVLLIFGAAKLPALARSVGQSVRILKAETKATDAEASDSAAQADTPVALTAMPTAEPVGATSRSSS